MVILGNTLKYAVLNLSIDQYLFCQIKLLDTTNLQVKLHGLWGGIEKNHEVRFQLNRQDLHHYI